MRTPTTLLPLAFLLLLGCDPRFMSELPDDHLHEVNLDAGASPNEDEAEPNEPDDPNEPGADAGDDTAPVTPGTDQDAGPGERDGGLGLGSDDAGDHYEEGPQPLPNLGDPIVLEPNQREEWVWIHMPEMTCSNGSEGGFAVNFTDRSRDLVIYLQGGGICYDLFTCLVGGAPQSVGNNPLYTSIEQFVRENHGIFNRNDVENPFRDSNFVVVPHCTGDHHTGDRVSTYGFFFKYHHRGYTNITRMLERVVPTFADADRVVLSGFSAGGVGITANYHQLATAFESVGQDPPYLVIDSGPFMRAPYLSWHAQRTLWRNWGLDGTVGTFCSSCFDTGFHDLYRVNGDLHPGLQSSLVCTYEDTVVQLLYGVMNGDPLFSSARMRAGMNDLADWGEQTMSPDHPSRHRVFFYEGTRHGALHGGLTEHTPGLREFLLGQLGPGDWPNHRP